jgi:hypothetical protein
MLTNPCSHCWCNSQGLIDSDEVIVHEVQGKQVLMILNFFGKPITQPYEAANLHSHNNVLRLNEAHRNVLPVRQYIVRNYF